MRQPVRRAAPLHLLPIEPAPPVRVAPLAPVDDILTVDEAAKLLRVSTWWLYDHAKGRHEPKIPCIRLGRSIRFRRASILRMVEKLETLSA